MSSVAGKIHRTPIAGLARCLSFPSPRLTCCERLAFYHYRSRTHYHRPAISQVNRTMTETAANNKDKDSMEIDLSSRPQQHAENQSARAPTTSTLNTSYKPNSTAALNALSDIYRDKLGDRLKELESQHTQHCVPPYMSYVIRLDGVSFSVFTRGLQKPFDEQFRQCFVKTTEDLVAKFHASLGYCQSDEISLIFPAVMTREEWDQYQAWVKDGQLQEHHSKPPICKYHTYNGRLSKLISVSSSFATARFNYYLSQQDWSAYPPKLQSRMLSHTATFDSRVIPCASPLTAMECIYWRSNFDSLRNAINSFARTQFHVKELHKKSIGEVCSMLQSKKNISIFSHLPCHNLFGTFVKRELYEMENPINHKIGLPIEGPVMRGRVRTGTCNWAEWSEDDRIIFSMSKYWDSDLANPPPKDALNLDHWKDRQEEIRVATGR